MKNIFLFAAVILASAAHAQTHMSRALDRGAVDEGRAISSAVALDPAPHAAPEFEKATALAALTLLLGGVAILKGWRHT